MGWGDELMLTGRVRELQASDPRRVRVVSERPCWHEAWDHNPRIAQPGESGDFQEVRRRENGLRPYAAWKTATRWIWRPYGPPRGEIYFTAAELEFGARHAGRIVLEPGIKVKASPNKDWGWGRWGRLASLLVAKGYSISQVGPPGTRLLPGAEHILTVTMRHAAAVLARARAAVLPEGGLHHVAAVVGCPAVVIFGGFIAPAVTGYAGQASLFESSAEHPLGCGSRVPCAHCQRAMQAITPERVCHELGEIL